MEHHLKMGLIKSPQIVFVFALFAVNLSSSTPTAENEDGQLLV